VWKKIRIAVGAIGVAVLGASASYWAYEKIGYEKNVHVFNERLDRVAYGGDGGIDTPQRAGVVKAIRQYAPKKVRLLGDVCYDVGCINEQAYQAHVAGPFGDFGPRHDETLLIGGNHSSYSLKQDERTYLLRKFQAGPIGKVRFDNYYGMHVYYNACEVYYESTVYDVKLGDPKIQKRQEEFVCKALADSRCDGKLKIVMTHQSAIGKGPRRNTKSGDYMDFDKRCIRGKADYVVSGHEHATLFSGRYSGTSYYIAGALAKLTVGKPGYLTLDDGVIRIREVATAPTMATDDD
jgi:hypothetical protein